MWHTGLLDLSIWQLIATTLLLTHVTIVSVTVYLHRYSAHRALELHPALKHFFRFWLWLTTAMNTREWTAIHRKHHAKCETPDDPHSPVHKGLATVVRKGAELYMAEAKNEETLRIYGKNCPDDWVERNLYSRFPNLGIVLMLAIDLALFGALGLTVWAVQMIWIPFWAAGVVSGLGHAVGYRNFECRDAATNLVPWGILIGGENCTTTITPIPTRPSSRYASGSSTWAGPGFACSACSAWPRSTAPRPSPTSHRGQAAAGHGQRHGDPQQPLPDHGAVPQAGDRAAGAPGAQPSRRDAAAPAAPCQAPADREPSLLQQEQQAHIDVMLAQSQALKVIYEKRLALQQIWSKTSANGHDMLAAIKQWVHEAEASGIQSLRDFAEHLRTYSLRPSVTPPDL